MHCALNPLSDQCVSCPDGRTVTEDKAQRQHQWLNAASTIASDMTNSDSQIAIWP
jgi:hypothetical protein